jgi:hypothetical protein
LKAVFSVVLVAYTSTGRVNGGKKKLFFLSEAIGLVLKAKRSIHLLNDIH